MSSLKYVLRKVYNVDRNSKYIALALKDKWEYKYIKYHGSTVKGLYRIQNGENAVIF